MEVFIMFKFRHSTLIALSGLLWFAVGISLLSLGLSLVMGAVQQIQDGQSPDNYPLLSLTGSVSLAACTILASGMLLGFLKARLVLAKSVNRVVQRIRNLPEPASLFTIYNLPYCILIGSMILLGMTIRFIGLADDIRGFIDITIGTALFNGSSFYFRNAKEKVQRT
jgi:hypothetical protein